MKGLQHSLSEEEIDNLAAAAHGFVGADLAAICNEAAMAALRRYITASKGPLARGHAATTQAAQDPAFPDNRTPSSPAVRSSAAAGPTSPTPAQHEAKLHQQPSLWGAAAGADCRAATNEVSQQDRAADLRVTLADFKVAETRVQPSAMREVGLEVHCCAQTYLTTTT